MSFPNSREACGRLQWNMRLLGRVGAIWDIPRREKSRAASLSMGSFAFMPRCVTDDEVRQPAESQQFCRGRKDLENVGPTDERQLKQAIPSQDRSVVSVEVREVPPPAENFTPRDFTQYIFSRGSELLKRCALQISRLNTA